MNPFQKIIFPDIKSTNSFIKKGDRLFLQNDEVQNMYFIQSGRIKLQRETLEGCSVIQHVAFKEEMIAEASLFSKKYHCSAIADKETEVSCLKKEDMLKHLEKNPSTMKQLLRLYAHQIMNLRTINEIKNIRSAQERTLAFLKNEMNKEGEVKLSISLKDAAYIIGLSHESFYRALKSLEETKQIIRHHKLIKLP